MSSTALSLGLEDGLKYATENPGDRQLLGRIAGAHTAEEVAGAVDGSAPNDVDDVVAYWSGFSHGVGQYLKDHLDL